MLSIIKMIIKNDAKILFAGGVGEKDWLQIEVGKMQSNCSHGFSVPIIRNSVLFA